VYTLTEPIEVKTYNLQEAFAEGYITNESIIDNTKIITDAEGKQYTPSQLEGYAIANTIRVFAQNLPNNPEGLQALMDFDNGLSKLGLSAITLKKADITKAVNKRRTIINQIVFNALNDNMDIANLIRDKYQITETVAQILETFNAQSTTTASTTTASTATDGAKKYALKINGVQKSTGRLNNSDVANVLKKAGVLDSTANAGTVKAYHDMSTANINTGEVIKYSIGDYSIELIRTA